MHSSLLADKHKCVAAAAAAAADDDATKRRKRLRITLRCGVSTKKEIKRLK